VRVRKYASNNFHMTKQSSRRIPKRHKSPAPSHVERLRAEIESLSIRLDEMHEIVTRKNAIIRLLVLGDCTASEFGLSDVKEFALLPRNRA
jgi:hypothetical protein